MSNTFLNETNARNDANLSCQFIKKISKREGKRERERESYTCLSQQQQTVHCLLTVQLISTMQ